MWIRARGGCRHAVFILGAWRGRSIRLVIGGPSNRTANRPGTVLKVLHVTHELSLTGAPRLALEIFRALGPAIELRTISGAGGPLEDEFKTLGPVRTLYRRPGGLDSGGHSALSLMAQGLGRLLAPVAGITVRPWQPDVMYVNSVAATTLARRLRLGDLPTLLHVHELEVALDRLSGSHLELLRTLPGRFIAVSNVVADELVAHRGVSRENVAVVPPLIDVNRLVSKADESWIGLAEDRVSSTPIVGGAGNPHWTKGVELWLLMARELVDRMGPDGVGFEWVGVRENAAAVEFRAMIRKLDLDPNVRLVAETANPYPRYRRFSVFAMTSWEEAASLVVLENMALGNPVVCFKGSGGPPEAIGEAGFVVDRFSPRAMADSIADLIGDPARRAHIGAIARERVSAINAPARIAGLMADNLALLAARGPVL
jgi:glycosyltransferase involved in cell wall biosynthesis